MRWFGSLRHSGSNLAAWPCIVANLCSFSYCVWSGTCCFYIQTNYRPILFAMEQKYAHLQIGASFKSRSSIPSLANLILSSLSIQEDWLEGSKFFLYTISSGFFLTGIGTLSESSSIVIPWDDWLLLMDLVSLTKGMELQSHASPSSLL